MFVILGALEIFGLSGQGTLALPWVNYYKRSLVQLSEKIQVKAPKSVVTNREYSSGFVVLYVT